MLSVCKNMQEGLVEAFPSVFVHSRPVGGMRHSYKSWPPWRGATAGAQVGEVAGGPLTGAL